MQFANQAISIFICGIFCVVWMGLFALPFDDYILVEMIKKVISNNATGILNPIGIFIVFPLSYTLGNVINLFASRLLDSTDNKIRHKVLTAALPLSKVEKLGDSLNFDTTDIEGAYENKIREKRDSMNYGKILKLIYHHCRYTIYISNSELYEYLSFHREIVRILRASFVNFALIFLSLIYISAKSSNSCSGSSALILYAILSSFLISICCLFSWYKQQYNFYRTIIQGYKSLKLYKKV